MSNINPHKLIVKSTGTDLPKGSTAVMLVSNIANSTGKIYNYFNYLC